MSQSNEYGKVGKRGVLVIPGTDLGGSFNFHRELELFGQLGYTPAEVLKLASARATISLLMTTGKIGKFNPLYLRGMAIPTTLESFNAFRFSAVPRAYTTALFSMYGPS